MGAANYDLIVERGVDLAIDLTIQSGGVTANLTGATICSQIRRAKESPVLAVAFGVTYPSRVNGQARLSLTAAQTSSVPTRGGFWDVLYAKPDGTFVRLVEGSVTLSQKVTDSCP
jgi:hypothetical protein